jgi:hypothetical protein
VRGTMEPPQGSRARLRLRRLCSRPRPAHTAAPGLCHCPAQRLPAPGDGAHPPPPRGFAQVACAIPFAGRATPIFRAPPWPARRFSGRGRHAPAGLLAPHLQRSGQVRVLIHVELEDIHLIPHVLRDLGGGRSRVRGARVRGERGRRRRPLPRAPLATSLGAPLRGVAATAVSAGAAARAHLGSKRAPHVGRHGPGVLVQWRWRGGRTFSSSWASRRQGPHHVAADGGAGGAVEGAVSSACMHAPAPRLPGGNEARRARASGSSGRWVAAAAAARTKEVHEDGLVPVGDRHLQLLRRHLLHLHERKGEGAAGRAVERVRMQ